MLHTEDDSYDKYGIYLYLFNPTTLFELKAIKNDENSRQDILKTMKKK